MHKAGCPLNSAGCDSVCCGVGHRQKAAQAKAEVQWVQATSQSIRMAGRVVGYEPPVLGLKGPTAFQTRTEDAELWSGVLIPTCRQYIWVDNSAVSASGSKSLQPVAARPPGILLANHSFTPLAKFGCQCSICHCCHHLQVYLAICNSSDLISV